MKLTDFERGVRSPAEMFTIDAAIKRAIKPRPKNKYRQAGGPAETARRRLVVLAALRKYRTAQALANAMGVSIVTVFAWKSGRSRVANKHITVLEELVND